MKTNWMRRSLALCLALVCLLPSFSMMTSATASGDLTEKSRSRSDIAKQYAAITEPNYIFITKPSLAKPYKTGSLQKSFLNSGLDYLNFMRYLAKLPPVQLSSTHNKSAQYGAVLLAATEQFTHYPTKPKDMPDDFYDAGYAATTSSNLSYRWGYNKKTSLISAVQGCMDDADDSNIDRVGHRRWFLNPTLKNVGFGYAEDTRGASYIVSKVFDESGDDVDYDYVAWPSSGYFPNEVFSCYVPWSVTLNPSVYKTPSYSNVNVELKRLSDGKVWKFNDSCDEDNYFNVDKGGYGVSNCIIFRPDYADFESGDMNGRFMVKISGIYKKNGTPATLEYAVDFFDMDTYKKLNITKQPTNKTVDYGETVKASVSALGSGLSYQWYFKEPGSSKWTKSSVKTNTYSYKMTAAKSGRQVFCVIADSVGNTVVSRTVTLKMNTPYILSQPKDAFAKPGTYATADLKAGGNGLKYKWFIKEPGSSKWVQSSVTSRNYSFIMTAAKSGRQAYCVIQDSDGNSVKTKTVTMSLPKPTITTQPKATVSDDKMAKATVKAEGDGLRYQWYYKHPYSSRFLKSTATSDTYSFKMSKSGFGRQVYCVVTNTYGQTVKSKTITFTMPKPKITKQPTNASVASGTVAKTTVKASGEKLKYQWYYKNPGTKTFMKSSVKTATYSCTMTSSKSGRQVYCIITDEYGQTVQSQTVTLKKL